MKFTDLLGNSTEDRDDTAPAPSTEPGTDATLTRPADIPPLVEQPVRFSRVPQPTMPPVPPYDDLLPAAVESETEVDEPTALDATGAQWPAPEPVAADTTDVEWPAPEPVAADTTDVEWPAPGPVAADTTDIEWPGVEPEPDPALIAWEPPTIERAAQAPAPEIANDALAEPEDLAEPTAVPELSALETAVPEPAAIEESAAAPPEPAPTAASVFGGQRTAGFANASAPVAEEGESNDDAMRIARFDAIDDDLLPVARRRARR